MNSTTKYNPLDKLSRMKKKGNNNDAVKNRRARDSNAYWFLKGDNVIEREKQIMKRGGTLHLSWLVAQTTVSNVM